MPHVVETERVSVARPIHARGWRRSRVAALLSLPAVLSLPAAPGHASQQCELPAAYQFRLEWREAAPPAESQAAATAAADAASVLYVGDRIVQVNGKRIKNCTDLESAAAEALAKGLVLLLGVERDGQLVSAAAEIAAPRTERAARAAPAPAASKIDTAVGVGLIATGIALVVLEEVYGDPPPAPS